MDAQLERRLLACPALPTLPSVASEVLERCCAPEIDLAGLVSTLSCDPALAARILKVAGAVAGAHAHPVTVERAAEALGRNALLATALSFSLVRNRRRGD